MTEFILTIIKYAVLLLCCLYSYAKLCAVRLKWIDLIFIPVFAAVSAGVYYLNLYIAILIPVCLLLVGTLAFRIRFKRAFFVTLTYSTIALGMTIFLMVVATVANFLPAFLYVFIKSETVQHVVSQSVTNLLIIIFTILIFRIKKFRNGIIFYKKDSTFERLILASVTCIFGLTLFYTDAAGFSNIRLLIFVGVAFFGFSFIIWWKRLASSDFQGRIDKRNFEIMEKMYNETAKERDDLLKQNEELSKIIHRDNKLLPALEEAVIDKCEPGGMLDTVQRLKAEREAAVENYEKTEYFEATGNLTVDAMLVYLHKKAQTQKTEFALDINFDAAGQLIKKFDDIVKLCTLICDLGENALIAIGAGGKLKILFGFEGEAPCIKFFDSGMPFDEKVISEMGRTKITTRKETGGSGLGLLNTFEIMRRHGFSMCIDEVSVKDGFTKCVGVIADGRCMHKVLSKRESVKRICAEREDFVRAI